VFEEYNIEAGEFPYTTLRSTAVKKGIAEILWIYQHQSNDLNLARSLGVDWWEDWNVGDDTIGNRYGYTVRKHDLINTLLKGLKENPFSTSHIVDLFQYDDLKSSKGLNPCAYSFLCSAREDKNGLILDLTLIQRSSDYIVAGYINKCQYVALQMMIAGHLGWRVGMFRHFVQNLHIYDRHVKVAREISKSAPKDVVPALYINRNKNFFDVTVDDFVIKSPMAKAYNLEVAI
jgi:thymidylate synthase